MLLHDEGAQPLRRFVEELRGRRQSSRREGDAPVIVPDFDPAEAGVDARVLLCLESPGPMTHEARAGRQGSGFVSPDNDDETAANMWSLRQAVGLGPSRALMWNIVPWMLGPKVKRPTADELAMGAMELRRLIAILPRLEVIVACGLPAQRAMTRHVKPFVEHLTYIDTWHTGAQAMNQPGLRADVERDLRRAVDRVGRE